MIAPKRAKWRIRDYAFAYSVAFALFYFLVFYLIPPASAAPILVSCTTSLSSKAITAITAPVSYFEILITAVKLHLNSGYQLTGLLVENFIVVYMLIYLTFPYLDSWAIKFRKKLSPHKVIFAALIATWIFSAISAISSCGTGTSIIGFSLSCLFAVSMIMDWNYYKSKYAKPAPMPWPYIIGLGLVLANIAGYLITNATVHLFGGAVFFVVLMALEPKARKAVFAWIPKHIKIMEKK